MEQNQFFSIISVISSMISGFLKSGLSLPYLSIASLNLILLKGGLLTSKSLNLVNTS